MPQTTRYRLPLLQTGQSQKEVTHNQALATVDVLLQLSVASRTVITPPDPAAGTWIIPSVATGTWAGQQGNIAVLDDSGWSYVIPLDGCIAFIADEGVFVCFANGAWHDGWPVRSLSVAGRAVLTAPPVAFLPPAGGTTIDSQARDAVVQLAAALQAQGILAAS